MGRASDAAIQARPRAGEAPRGARAASARSATQDLTHARDRSGRAGAELVSGGSGWSNPPALTSSPLSPRLQPLSTSPRPGRKSHVPIPTPIEIAEGDVDGVIQNQGYLQPSIPAASKHFGKKFFTNANRVSYIVPFPLGRASNDSSEVHRLRLRRPRFDASTSEVAQFRP